MLLFAIESVAQITCITTIFFYKRADKGDFTSAFADVFKGIISIKLVFFLPVYLLYYLLRKDFSAKFVLNHIRLQIGCFVLLFILLTPFMASEAGLGMTVIAIAVAVVIAFIFWIVLKLRGDVAEPEVEL